MCEGRRCCAYFKAKGDIGENGELTFSPSFSYGENVKGNQELIAEMIKNHDGRRGNTLTIANVFVDLSGVDFRDQDFLYLTFSP